MEKLERIEIGKKINSEQDDKGTLLWHWLEADSATFAILGDKHQSVRVKTVKDIAGLVAERCEDSVYWITDDDSDLTGKTFLDSSIPILESYGDIDKNYDPDQIFKHRRNHFAYSYFEMYTQAKLGKPFREVSNPISYRGSLEGPLYGYERMISELSEYKEILQAGLDNVKEIIWHESSVGKKYIIDTSLSQYEQAVSFVLAVWNLWAMISLQEVEKQFLLIVELPKSMVISDRYDTPIRHTVQGMMEILKSITEVGTVSMILSNETMFPIVEIGIRDRLILQTSNSDFNVYDDNARAYFGDDIYNEWNSGNKTAAILLDDYTGNSEVINLGVRAYEEEILIHNEEDVIVLNRSIAKDSEIIEVDDL